MLAQETNKVNIAKTLGVAELTIWNAPASSATPKGRLDHRRQLKWMMTELFSWLKNRTTPKTI